MSDEFVLQLIQKSLEELGYESISEQLGESVKAKRKGAALVNRGPIIKSEPGTTSNTAGSSQTEGISWFQGELKQGNYDPIEKYLIGLSENPHDSSILDLENSRDPTAVILTALYLIRRTRFFEKLITGPSGQNQEVLLDYLRQQLVPLLDKLQARESKLSESEFDFGQGFSVAQSFDSRILSRLNRESESSLLLDLTIENSELQKSRAIEPQYHFGYNLKKGEIASGLRNLLVDTFLAKLFKNDKRTFDTIYDIPTQSLQTIIRQSVIYRKSQIPYYLVPRSEQELSTRTQESELNLGLEKNSRDLSDHYKSTFPNKLLHTLSNHSYEVWCAKFSPSGKYLVTGSSDGKLIIHDVRNNFKVLQVLESSSAMDSRVFLTFDKKPTGEKSVIYCAWDPHEQYLVSCHLDTIVRVWYVGALQNVSLNKIRVTRSMNEHASSGDFKLVSCFVLGSDIKTWTCEFLPSSPGENPYSNQYLPRFIVGSPDKALKAFNIEGHEVFDFYGNIDDDIDNPETEATTNDVNMKTESHTDSDGAESTRSDLKSPDIVLDKALENSFNRINDIAISPNGKILVTASNDRQLQFYQIPSTYNDEASTKRIASMSLKGRLTSCSISSNGKYLLVNCAPEELQVWDISQFSDPDTSTGLESKPVLYRKLVGHSQSIHVVRSSFGYLVDNTGEEELVISGSDDGYIYYWKLHTGQLIGRVKGHQGLCNSVDWNRTGSYSDLVDYGKLWCSVGDDKLVKIWGPE